MPVYKFDKSYSCLISAPAPLNCLVIPFIPYFCVSKNIMLRRWVNKQILKLLHFPVAIVAVLTFFVGNLVCLPLAYLKALLHKMLILKRLQTRKSLVSFFTFSFIASTPTLSGIYSSLLNYYNYILKAKNLKV